MPTLTLNVAALLAECGLSERGEATGRHYTDRFDHSEAASQGPQTLLDVAESFYDYEVTAGTAGTTEPGQTCLTATGATP